MSDSDRYVELLGKKRLIQEDIVEEKERLHNIFREKHKKVFWWLDFFVVLIIFFNFGAVLITNLMVVRETPAILENLAEINPVQAKINGFTPHPHSAQLFAGIMFQGIVWGIIILGYISLRRNVLNNVGLTLLIFIVSAYFVMLGLDFFNDLGFLAGKFWIFGG